MKSKIKVIDNFLNKEFFLQLKDLILGEHFSWFFNDYKVYKNDDDFQFTHTVIKESKTTSTFIKYINPILSNLKAKKTIQVKLNLQTKKNKIYNHIFHTDIPDRSEEHTSELQSRLHLVCRLLLEKKKKKRKKKKKTKQNKTKIDEYFHTQRQNST